MVRLAFPPMFAGLFSVIKLVARAVMATIPTIRVRSRVSLVNLVIVLVVNIFKRLFFMWVAC